MDKTTITDFEYMVPKEFFKDLDELTKALKALISVAYIQGYYNGAKEIKEKNEKL
jgi:hypothetical protein